MYQNETERAFGRSKTSEDAYSTVTNNFPVLGLLLAVIVAVPLVGPNVATLLEAVAKFTILSLSEVQVVVVVTSEPPEVAVNVTVDPLANVPLLFPPLEQGVIEMPLGTVAVTAYAPVSKRARSELVFEITAPFDLVRRYLVTGSIDLPCVPCLGKQPIPCWHGNLELIQNQRPTF